MPNRPQKPCRYPMCPNTCEKGHAYCQEHSHLEKQKPVREAYKRYASARWRKASKIYLANNPICCLCKADTAKQVDHIEQVYSDSDAKFWDVNNWQGLCVSCHSKKTARENGGFGNRKK